MKTTSSGAPVPRAAAIYIRQRVAGNSVGAQGIERQIRACDEVVQRHGWELTAVFMDYGGASDTARPGYSGLLGAIEGGEVTAVAVLGWDRLCRNRRQFTQLANLCRRYGVTVAVQRGPDFDPTGKNDDVTAAMIGYEIATLTSNEITS
jgi:DNA invertase Pin-like site-specific DNA recombinase